MHLFLFALSIFLMTFSVPLAALCTDTTESSFHVVLHEFPLHAYYPGKVKSLADMTIRNRLTGRVESFSLEFGAKKKQGDILVQLDDKLPREAVRSAEGQVRSAEAQVEKARLDLERADSLFSGGVIARHSLDNARSAYQSALGQLSSARAALASAQEQLTFTQVRAPFDGIIGKRYIEQGELLQPGSPVVDMRALGSLVVEFVYPQEVGIEAGMPVAIGDSHGSVVGVTPNVEFGTRTARAVLENPRDLIPGMVVTVQVVAGRVFSPAIPESFLSPLGQLQRVYLAGGSTPSLGIIKTGMRHDGMVQVLSGLEAGDVVIRPGE